MSGPSAAATLGDPRDAPSGTGTVRDQPTKPRVSVVVPAYRRADLLEHTVRSLLAQDLPAADYEIIVVDSSPDEQNLLLVRSLVPLAAGQLQCLRKPAEGPGPSRNLGAHQAQAPLVAFIDSDCQAAPGWLRAGIAAFADPQVGLVQGRTVPDPAAVMTSMSRSLLIETENGLYETANMFYRRSAFEASGGFERDATPHALQPTGGEDTDLAWRIKHQGWTSAFVPDALVMHAVLPITRGQWLVDRRFLIFPRLAARHPQLRRQFYARYFYDEVQAWLVLGLLGTVLGAAWSPWCLLAWAPYVARRVRDRSTSSWALRWLRPLLYLPRDLCTFACLLVGSLRYRALLL